VVFNYKNANWDSFGTELSSAPWDLVFATNIDDIWERWKCLFFKAVRNNIPSKKIKPKKNVLLITSQIGRLLHKHKINVSGKEQKLQTTKSYNDQNDWNNYKSLTNQPKSDLNKSYWSHIHLLIELENTKQFWSFIISKNKYQLELPTVELNNEGPTSAADKA